MGFTLEVVVEKNILKRIYSKTVGWKKTLQEKICKTSLEHLLKF